MAKRVFLSAVVPLYNEETRLFNLPKICMFLKRLQWTTELIVVNDGSRDGTAQELKQLQKKYGFRVLSYPRNRGKGYAVRYGMLRAKGEYHIFFDLDLSVPLRLVPTLCEQLQRHDVVIGTRRLRSSQVLTHQPQLRERFGQIFTLLSRHWLGLHCSDFTCGFKGFSADASQRIFGQLHTERWGFDTELLFVAERLGYSIFELPVTWKNDARSKVKFPQDLFRSGLDLFEIRYHYWRGRYQ